MFRDGDYEDFRFFVTEVSETVPGGLTIHLFLHCNLIVVFHRIRIVLQNIRENRQVRRTIGMIEDL